MHFEWLSQIFDALLSFFPRREIVRNTHGGVRWSLWRKPREIKPGVRFYWPLITDIEIIPTARQPHNASSQSLVTSDGEPVSIAVSIACRINDVLLAIGARNYDIDLTINERARIAAANIVLGTEYKDLFAEDVADRLTRECRKQLKKYGVFVESASLTDFTTCRPLNLIGIPDPAGE
jgi:regulator of protease activity HflC (stomatin/prohibitin superfamily)